jgi:hypothetical protein
MGRVERYPAGSFCWIDLGTTDMTGARRFYPGLFGWELVDVGSAGAPYLIARLDGLDVCGLHEHSMEEGSGWTSYVAVDDVDVVRERARELGAELVGEVVELPGTARIATVRDPAGALVTFWEPKGFAGAGVVNEAGTWSWNELVAPDLDRAAAFYGPLLGWQTDRAPGAIDRRAFRSGDRLIAGGHTLGPGEAPEPRWDVSFRVADVHDAVDRVEALGGHVVLAPMEIPIGRFTIVTDNAGVPMTLTEFAQVVGGVDGS